MRGRRSITGTDKYSSPPTPCPKWLWGRAQRPVQWLPRLLRRRVKWPQCKTHNNSIQCRGCECMELYTHSIYMTSLVPWSTLHLPFADNYIATTCSLRPVCSAFSSFCRDWQHSTCVCGSVKGDESNNFKDSSQWDYECSSTEDTNNRVTVKTPVQSVLNFTATFADHIHEFKCILATPFI